MMDNPTPMEAFEPEDDWLGLARTAYENSTDWLDNNMRKQWERNLASFQNRHAPGSKYHSEAYRGRSRLYIPKTRAAMCGNEAAVAAAYFSTGDVLHVEPQNASDPVQVAAAQVMGELLNYRLQKTVPWFLTLVGAFQDASVSSVCVSKQWWDIEVREIEEPVLDAFGQPVLDSETGEPVTRARSETVRDEPRIDLIPVENLRIDPASDWLRPVESSPFLIYLVPMTAATVREKMAAGVWKEMDLAQVLGAVEPHEDSTRQAREAQRVGTYETRQVDEFSTVWVHENIVRRNGQDYVFWTLGTIAMLTDPVPIEEIYLHGKRPFVIGVSNLESHRVYPAATIELGQDVQVAINDIVNQRIDNVQLVLNKRYRVKRGANVDMRALQRSTPGGITMMDDLNAVATDPVQDVTGSAFAEQDRLQMAFDEVTGAFSNASVQGNRALNETATGMELMSDGANAVREYRIRVFNETWVEPVLRQLMLLEREYETSEVVLQIAAERAQLFEEWRNSEALSQLLQQDMDLVVNVGMGATNPQQRVEKFLFGLNAMSPFIGAKLKVEEVVAEVFGALGYKDGKRFYDPAMETPPPPDPKAAEMQARMQIEQMKIQADMQKFQLEMQHKQAEMMLRRDIEIAKAAAQERLTVAEIESRLGMTGSQEQLKQAELALKQAEIQTKREVAALAAQQHQNELAFKARSGRDGI